jgi:hypothetical protein
MSGNEKGVGGGGVAREEKENVKSGGVQVEIKKI